MERFTIKISSRSIAKCILYGAISLFFIPSTLKAQEYYGGIVGTVTDSLNAAVPTGMITITNTQTGVKFETPTNRQGYYSIGELIPGLYSVAARSDGFATSIVGPIKVDVSRTITVNVILKVGAVSESVHVEASAPLLDKTSGTVGTVISTQTVLDMPLNGRTFTQLLELTPGSVSTGNINMAAGGSNYSLSGMSDAQNSFTLDGVYNNEEFFGQFALQPVVDSIQEFKEQTNITSAEFGRSAGANVAVATKSGTNQFHGSAWEFFRNDGLDANPWFSNHYSNPRAVYHQNQFGATSGGPIYIPHIYNGKNRAFWFADYEGTLFTESATEPGTIPTTAMLNGDFSAPGLPTIYDPATTTQTGVDSSGNPIYSRQPFPGNIIPTGRISSITSAYAKIFYPPTTVAPPNNIARALPDTSDSYQWNSRVDYDLSNSLHLLGRVSDQHITQSSPTSLPAETGYFDNTFVNTEIGLTWILSPNTFVDVKSSYNRSDLISYNNDPGIGATAFLSQYPMQGITVTDLQHPLFPTFGVAGYSSPNQGASFFLTNFFQQQASLSMQRGRHSIKIGFELDHVNAYTDNVGLGGRFSFDNVPTSELVQGAVNPNTGNPVASFLLALPSSGSRNIGHTAAYMRQWEPSGYFQDDIHVSQALVVNLGIRYEYDQWPYEKYNRLSDYYFDTHSFGWAGTNPITGAAPNAPRSLMNPIYTNVAPRVGLAFTVDPKTVLRSSFGIFYEGDYYWIGQGERGQWPYAVSEGYSATNSRTPNSPLATYMPSYLEPTAAAAQNVQQAVVLNNRTPYTEQWSLGVQHELANNLLLEVNYIGNVTKHGVAMLNGNTAEPGPGVVGSAQHPRSEQQYAPSLGPLNLNDNLGFENYNALQAKLDKRFSNRLQAMVSYAYSHTLETPDAGNYVHFESPQIPNCLSCDYSSSDFDRRHILTVSGIYSPPVGRGLHFASHINPVLNAFIGNWELSGIYHFNSGSPYSIYTPFDNANTGEETLEDRPDYLGGPQKGKPSKSDPTIGFLNPNAFQVAAPYHFGDVGRNSVTQPSYYNLDAGLYKNFPIREGKESLQFRSEFFNLPNSHAMGCIDSDVQTPGFGQSGCTQGGSRIIQLALKLYW